MNCLARTAGVALLALCSLPASAMGRNVGYGEFAVADDVVSVQRCGHWRAGEQEGFYRVVVAERYAQSFVYVQRMQRSGADGALRAVHTLSIAELNNDHANITLDAVRCSAQGQRIVLRAKADGGPDNPLRGVQIDIGPEAGRYRFQALPAPARR